MKIAIATDDRKTIAKRTGRAKEFAFFDLDDKGGIIGVSYEENQHKHDDEHEHRDQGYHRGQGKSTGRGKHHHDDAHHQHHHHEHGEHHHNEIIDQMKDKNIDILLVRAVGKYLRQDLLNGNIPYKVIKKGENIEEIVLSYWESTQE
jgi:predicted Fe-Mo cluster-binding NifX family protein